MTEQGGVMGLEEGEGELLCYECGAEEEGQEGDNGGGQIGSK